MSQIFNGLRAKPDTTRDAGSERLFAAPDAEAARLATAGSPQRRGPRK